MARLIARLRSWLLSLLIGDVYVIADGPEIVGVAASLQGAELVRADRARWLAAGMDGRVTDEDYQTCYGRQRIELHRLRDVD